MTAAARGPVAVVTDSTASLPPALVEASGVVVVPLHVVIDGVDHREGIDLDAGTLVGALRGGAVVSTAHPGPEAFARVYAQLASEGVERVVSVHLSAEMSGTVEAARLAAEASPVPVLVVDSRTVGMGLGMAVLAAARRADAARDRPVWSGGPAQDVATVAQDVAACAAASAASSTVWFAVDTLEHLRRGGRLGTVAATVGTVLGVRPVLTVRDGRIEVLEKARTSARARRRVVELAVAAARDRVAYDLAVHHLGEPEVAAGLATQLRAACPTGLGRVHVAQVSAVVGAHVGPGVVAVVLADG